MNIAVEGKNHFYTGWAACLLGLSRKHPKSLSMKAGDVAQFIDGWNMCQETRKLGGPRLLGDLFKVFEREVEIGNVRVFWADDENKEIEEQP